MGVKLAAASGGSVELVPTNTASNYTITLPASTSTVLTTTTAGIAISGPAFGAYQGTTQSIPTATWTKLTINTEEFDTNSNYDTSLYRFTPTVAGYYQINGMVQVGSSLGLAVAIYKNGSSAKIGVYGASQYAAVVSSLVYCNGSTDYLELYVYAASAVSTIASSAQNWFNGALVRVA